MTSESKDTLGRASMRGNRSRVHRPETVRCEAQGNYTHFYLKDSKKITVSKTLKEYEALFNDNRFFFRLHQSHLINLNYMERYDKKDGGAVIMKDKSALPVAVRKKNDLLKLLESICVF